MSRFVANRRFFITLCTIASLAGSSAMVASQSAYADTSWAELLKPLVKNVIVPGASMGMKKLVERSEKKHAAATNANPATSASTTDSSVTTTSPDSAESFATPEEPASQSNPDTMLSTPEEPISTAANPTASTAEPPPPPPPPVATP